MEGVLAISYDVLYVRLLWIDAVCIFMSYCRSVAFRYIVTLFLVEMNRACFNSIISKTYMTGVMLFIGYIV